MSAPPQPTSAAFALAKIQPPRPRAGLVARPALEQALGAALQRSRLTLLLAPAGYGKTAALTRQIRQLPADCALAWVSADEDDQLQRFLACLSAALEAYDLPWRVAPDALGTLAQGERGLRDVAAEVVNALAGAEVTRGLIVVDDAHRIVDPQVFELLQLMLERLPAHWSVAIASRIEPPLPLARWRAAGELAEFRQRELSFSEADVAALLADAGGGDSSPQTVQAMMARTDGWAAGLRLSLSARDGSPAGINASMPQRASATQRHLFDYLAAEVLDDMPPALRDFLLRCSVLSELTAARCAQVSGHADAANLLEQIERRSLFVSVLDADEPTLRLHDLFRDFLEDRLAREHAAELPDLLRRAAAHESDLPRAMAYLSRAGAWGEAAQALMVGGPPLLVAGGGASLEQMLAQFPATELRRQPDLHLLRGLVAFSRYDWDAILLSMQHAADLYARQGQTQNAAVASAYACAGLHHTGRFDEAERGLARLRQQPLDDSARAVTCYVAAWDAFSRGRGEDVAPLINTMLDALERLPDMGLWHQCANISLLAGLPEMAAPLERAANMILYATGETPTQHRAGALHIRTMLALDRGDLDQAWVWLQRADADCRWLGMPRLLQTSNVFIHALLHALRGEPEALRASTQGAWQDLQQHGSPGHRRVHGADMLMAAARAAWVLEDEGLVRQMHAALLQAENGYEWAGAARGRALSRAFVALIEGRLVDAQDALAPLTDETEHQMLFPALQARLMLADVQLRLGSPDAAVATLRPWLATAQRGERLGGALLAGRRVLERLAAADWGTRLSNAERAVFARLAETLRVVRGGVAAPHAGESRPASLSSDDHVAGLSQREHEVLARMAAGDSNKLIARAFDLSPHTVKRHVANILNKLEVDTRGQAAARWRADVRP